MTTIPSRLSQVSRVSGNPTIARKRVLQLYRNWCRSAPEIIASFGLNCSPSDIRHAVRSEIERHRYVSDPKVIDVLLLKGHQNYQEVMNCWAQESHILGQLLQPKTRPERTFMQKFLEGRDEDQVLPAASGVLAKDTVI